MGRHCKLSKAEGEGYLDSSDLSQFQGKTLWVRKTELQINLSNFNAWTRDDPAQNKFSASFLQLSELIYVLANTLDLWHCVLEAHSKGI